MVSNVSEHSQVRPEGGDRTPARTLRGRLGSPFAIEAAWTIATMVVAGLVAVWLLKLWDLPIHVPLNTSGDALLNVAAIKSIIEHGWYFTNHQLGAPLGQEQYDFSALDADNLNFIGIKVLTLFSSDPVAVLNMYYLLGYPIVAGAGYLGMRALGVSRPSSLVVGVLFTALPYHWERGAGHLFLGDYFAVPGACWLVLRTLTGEPILRAREGVTGPRRWAGPALLAVAAVVVAAGGSTLYYAVFTIMLVGAAALLRALVTRSWRAALPGLGAAVAVGLVLVVNLSPALVYQHRHGHDTAVAERQPVESEYYSTSLTKFVLPIPGHRLAPLARVSQRQDSATLAPGEFGTAGGFFAAAGFIGLLLLLVVRVLRGPPVTPSPRIALAGAAAVALLLTFLLATFGGINELIAYIISPQIRAWTRLTPFLAFFSLLAVAMVLDAGTARLIASRGVRRGGALATVGLAAVVVIGVLDQTSKSYTPVYQAVSGPWTDDGRFVAAIERQVPQGSMILQLPFHPFPEAGADHEMGDYDELIGYAHSKHLRWSFGAMRGRAQDWTDEAAERPLPDVLKAAVAAGFAGVYIDRAAYADHGAAVEAAVRRTLGRAAPVVGTDDGRLVFYGAAPLAAQQQSALSAPQRKALADGLIHPTSLEFGSGTYAQETGADGQPFHWISADGKLTVQNDANGQRQLVLSATAKAAPGTVTITPPGGRPTTITFTRGAERVRIPFTAPAGTSTIAIHATTPGQAAPPDTRDLRVQLFGTRVTSASAARSNQP